VTGFEQRFEHASSITQNYKFLLQQLDLEYSNLLNELLARGVIDPREKERVSSHRTNYDRNEQLLTLLMAKTRDQFDEFLCALDETGQRHVRELIEHGHR